MVASSPKSFLSKIVRRKTVDASFLETKMNRCLTTFDITLLGIGHMIGAGIYVLTGAVVRDTAGSGVVLSFIFAGIASLLSALCYAEFGARVPKAGSAYTYGYVTVGEIWAFIIGWNIILEHMLGAAAVARSWSGYLDSLLGHVIRNETISRLGVIGGETHWNILGDYPDFIAFFVVVVVCLFTGVGAKCSTRFNTVFTIINVCVISFIVIFGFTKADSANWNDPGRGGFLPYGFSGVLAGAASCFFAYIGFDSIATSGEEASNPAKSIPVATFTSMAVVTLAYVLAGSALTLMLPYNLVHPSAAFSDAFEQRGVIWAKYVVAVGALSGMTTSLVGGMFALPRCVYAMAADGLIFRVLAHIHEKTQVPTLAVVVFGSATAVIALLFDIATLVEFLSIGTLMAYTIVSASVIILRYRPLPSAETTNSSANVFDGVDLNVGDKEAIVDDAEIGGTLKPRFYAMKPLFGRFAAGSVVAYAVGAQLAFMLCLAAVCTHGGLLEGHIVLLMTNVTANMLNRSYMFWCFNRQTIKNPLGTWWSIVLAIHFGLLVVVTIGVVCMFEQNKADLRFKVPLVPLIPMLSNLINCTLVVQLPPITWLRLLIWLIVGFLLYFLYGVRHSTENQRESEYKSIMENKSAAQTPTVDAVVKYPAVGADGKESVTITKK